MDLRQGQRTIRTTLPTPALSLGLGYEERNGVFVYAQSEFKNEGLVVLDDKSVRTAAYWVPKATRTVESCKVEISVYEDRSYTFVLKTPPASVLLANAAKIKLSTFWTDL